MLDYPSLNPSTVYWFLKEFNVPLSKLEQNEENPFEIRVTVVKERDLFLEEEWYIYKSDDIEGSYEISKGAPFDDTPFVPFTSPSKDWDDAYLELVQNHGSVD